MNKVQEALKSAIEAFELHAKQYPHMVKGYCVDALEDCKSALSDIEKCEPVVIDSVASGIINGKRQALPMGAVYYTSPISKEWVGLSDQQIQNLIINSDNYSKFQFIKYVEHTLKQLNAKKG